MNFLFVAFGGALGAVARYAISLIPVKTGFPIHTLITNIVGAVLIGFIVGFTDNRDGISENVVLFWKTGVCGGFTTFSTFSLDAWYLIERGQTVASAVYMIASVVLSVGALIAALHVVRAFP